MAKKKSVFGINNYTKVTPKKRPGRHTKRLNKHKRTGKEYKDKAEFDADVADPNTDTTAEDFQQDLIITPASIGGKSDTK